MPVDSEIFKGPAGFIIPIVILVFIWELVVDIGLISSSLLPAPSTLLIRATQLSYPEPILIHHILESLYRFAVGYILAVIAGIGIGVLMGMSRIWYKMLNPFVSLFISLPTIAWVPLLLVIVGLGDATIIIAIFLGAFFPMVYNTTTGIQGVPQQLIWASRSMGAGRGATFLHVVIPGSMVSILTGMKLGVGNAWRALVGAEMLAATMWGLGFMIYAARAFYDIRAMFIGLVLIGLLSYLVDMALIQTIENKTIRKWGMVRE